jgi:hypothetical protein
VHPVLCIYGDVLGVIAVRRKTIPQTHCAAADLGDYGRPTQDVKCLRILLFRRQIFVFERNQHRSLGADASKVHSLRRDHRAIDAA